MRKTLLLLALLSAPWAMSNVLSRADADSLSAKAAGYYAEGDPTTALVLYDSVHTAFTSPALLFNIGNCHFKLNDIPRAVLFYERALKLAPGDEDVQANLELARQSVVDRVNELPSFSLGSTWGRLRGGDDADQWARRSLWSALICALLFAAALMVRNRAGRRALFMVGGAMVLITGLAVAFASFRHAEVTSNDEAIIMTAKVDVRSEPRTNTTVLFVLHKGTKVAVLQEANGWSEVRLANGNVGWMPPGSLERI
jgi:tetratricopeptide (TPR) repeat protein